MVEDGLVDGRRPRQRRDPLVGDPLHHRRHVEHGVGNDRRSPQQAGEDPRLEAEGVEERVDDQVAIALPQPDHLGPEHVCPDARRVAEHGPLGRPGGPRGEEDVGRVVARQGLGPGLDLVRRDLTLPRARKSGQLVQPAGTEPRRITFS